MPVSLYVALLFSGLSVRRDSQCPSRDANRNNLRCSLASPPVSAADFVAAANLHTADFVVSPASVYVGKTLKESAFRTLFRINIISIERGEDKINIPEGIEMLYPYDKITVVGTDDDLGAFRQALEEKQACAEPRGKASTAGMKIKNVCLDAASSVIGKTIREIKSENLIILGIERNGAVMMNPSPALSFREGDVVWMVGKEGVEDQFLPRCQ